MTTRQRVITTASAKAMRAIRWEADANGEQVHEAKPAIVRRHVEDAICADSRAESFSFRRMVTETVRDMERGEGFRKGWWS